MKQILQSTMPLPELKHMKLFLYYLFSFFSGVFETGVLTGGLIQFDLEISLALVLAYQIGCLVRNPLNLSLQGALYALCCSAPMFLLNQDSFWLLLIATVLASAGIQCIRQWLLPEENLAALSTKRIIRVSGFTFGILGCFSFGLVLLAWVSVVAVITVLPIAFRKRHLSPFIKLNRNWGADGYGWTMLVHQVHYFTYAYVLLALFVVPQAQNSEEHIFLPPVIASAWFALGWFSYISGKWLLKKSLRMSALQAAFLGHLWVAICLIFMALFHNLSFVLGLAWVLGGFGGGSVYAIKDLAREDSCKADLELWEHFGHVLGVCISLVCVMAFPDNLSVPFIFALTATLATLVLLSRPSPRCWGLTESVGKSVRGKD